MVTDDHEEIFRRACDRALAIFTECEADLKRKIGGRSLGRYGVWKRPGSLVLDGLRVDLWADIVERLRGAPTDEQLWLYFDQCAIRPVVDRDRQPLTIARRPALQGPSEFSPMETNGAAFAHNVTYDVDSADDYLPGCS